MFASKFEVFLLVLCIAVSIRLVDSSNFERVDQLINFFRDGTSTPGMAAAVVENGEVVFTRSYGLRNQTDENSHVTSNTLFQIASCSKAFTSYLIASLVRDGLIAYDDPVIKHIPEFQLSDLDVTKNIHVKDLLAHASGLPAHDALWYHSDMSRNEILKRLPYLQLSYGLREKFQYSNVVYAVAGMLVERVTNRSWEEEIHERIFKPLNMTLSLASYAEAQRLPHDADIANGYSTERNGSKVVPLPQEDVTVVGPAGSLYSTVSDMVKWVRFQMSETVPKEMHVLKMPYPSDDSQLIDKTSDGHFRMYLGYAYGWSIALYRGQYFIGHSGQTDGYCTSVSLIPKKKRGYVIFGNMDTVCLIFSELYRRMDDIIENRPLEESDEEWLSKIYSPPQNSNDTLSEKQVDRPEQYVGHYWEPGYGHIVVSIGHSGLSIAYNNIDYLLKPEKGHDFFIAEPQNVARTDGARESECSFVRDSSNDVVACRINFEPAVAPIIFTKQFSEENDPKYLGLFVGTFISGTSSVQISLNL